MLSHFWHHVVLCVCWGRLPVFSRSHTDDNQKKVNRQDRLANWLFKMASRLMSNYLSTGINYSILRPDYSTPIIMGLSRCQIPSNHALHSRDVAFGRWVLGPFLNDVSDRNVLGMTSVGLSTYLMRSVMSLSCFGATVRKWHQCKSKSTWHWKMTLYLLRQDNVYHGCTKPVTSEV